MKFLCQKNCKERIFFLTLWHLKLFGNVMLTAAKPEISLSALLGKNVPFRKNPTWADKNPRVADKNLESAYFLEIMSYSSSFIHPYRTAIRAGEKLIKLYSLWPRTILTVKS